MLIYMIIYAPLVDISTPNMGSFVTFYVTSAIIHRTRDLQKVLNIILHTPKIDPKHFNVVQVWPDTAELRSNQIFIRTE